MPAGSGGAEASGVGGGAPSGLDRLAAALHAQRLWWYGALILVHAAAFTGRWVPGDDAGVVMVLARQKLETGALANPLLLALGVHPGYPSAVSALAGQVLAWGGGWSDVVRWLLVGNVVLAGAWLAAVRVLAGWTLRAPSHATAATLCCGYSALMLEQSGQTLPDVAFAAGAAWWLVGVAAWCRPGGDRGAARAGWLATGVAGGALMLSTRSMGVVVLAAALPAAAWWGWRRGGWWHWRRRDARDGGSSPRRVSVPAVWWAVAASVIVLGVVAWWAGLGRGVADDAGTLRAALSGDLLERLSANAERLLLTDLSEAVTGSDLTPIGNAAAAVVVIGAALWCGRRRPYWACLVVAFVGLWLVFLSTTRYVLPLLPVLVLSLFDAADRWDHRERQRRPAQAPGWAGVVVLLTLGIGNVAGVVNVVGDQLQRRRGNVDAAAEAAWAGGQAVRTHRAVQGLRSGGSEGPAGRPVVVYPGDRASALMWWGGCWAVPVVPFTVWDDPPVTYERGNVSLVLDAEGRVVDADRGAGPAGASR